MILGIETSHQLGDLHLCGLDFLLGVDDRHGTLDVGNVFLDPLERVLLGVGPVGGVRPGVPSSALLHAVPGVGVQQVLLVRRTIFPVVKERGEGIPGEEDVSVATFAAFMNDIKVICHDRRSNELNEVAIREPVKNYLADFFR